MFQMVEFAGYPPGLGQHATGQAQTEPAGVMLQFGYHAPRFGGYAGAPVSDYCPVKLVVVDFAGGTAMLAADPN